MVPRIKKIMANETDRITSKTVDRQSTANVDDDDDEESDREGEATIKESCSEIKLSSASDDDGDGILSDDADDDADYGEEKKDEVPNEQKLKKLNDDLETVKL